MFSPTFNGGENFHFEDDFDLNPLQQDGGHADLFDCAASTTTNMFLFSDSAQLISLSTKASSRPEMQNAQDSPASNSFSLSSPQETPGSFISENGSTSRAPCPLACPRCSYTAKTRRDVDRHVKAVHEKKRLYFCTQPSCHRSRKGWSRKDLRDRHVRSQHISDSSPVESASASDPLAQELGLIGVTGQGNGGKASHDSPQQPAGHREESVADQLREERRLRVQLEAELLALRKRYEEREDMWLKALVGKVEGVRG